MQSTELGHRDGQRTPFDVPSSGPALYLMHCDDPYKRSHHRAVRQCDGGMKTTRLLRRRCSLRHAFPCKYANLLVKGVKTVTLLQQWLHLLQVDSFENAVLQPLREQVGLSVLHHRLVCGSVSRSGIKLVDTHSSCVKRSRVIVAKLDRRLGNQSSTKSILEACPRLRLFFTSVSRLDLGMKLKGSRTYGPNVRSSLTRVGGAWRRCVLLMVLVCSRP